MKKIFAVALIILVLLLIIFSFMHFSNKTTKELPEPTPATTQNITLTEFNPNCLYAYRLQRDAFVDFVNNASADLSFTVVHSERITESTETLILESRKFTFDKDIYSFITDEIAIKNFIGNSTTEIKNLAVIAAPNTPLTVVVASTDSIYFITVKEDLDNEENIYTLYSNEEYKRKFSVKQGSLIINNKQIKTTIAPEIYYSYADVPLIETLGHLNAHIEKEDSGNYKISVNENVYYLDIENKVLFNKKDKKLNLLNLVVGGSVFVYPLENDLMVDTATLNGILYQMGINKRPDVDWENSCVVLVDR